MLRRLIRKVKRLLCSHYWMHAQTISGVTFSFTDNSGPEPVLVEFCPKCNASRPRADKVSTKA